MELTSYCPKCKGQLEQGFIVDHAPGVDGKMVSEWVAGAPIQHFWSGLEVKNALKITTYRCTHCGYLESYAK